MSRTRRHKVDAEGRECSRCDTYKSWAEYYDGAGANGKDTRCKDCMKGKQRARNALPEVQAVERERWPERWKAAHPGQEYQRRQKWRADANGRECSFSGEGNCGHAYKPWSEFRERPRSSRGGARETRCRACQAYRKLFQVFSITYGQLQWLEKQAVFGAGLCDLHAGPETMRYQRWGHDLERGLSIDHAHDCSQGHPPEKGCKYCIRGLVCCECNRTILRMVDLWPALAARFADYLARRPLLEPGAPQAELAA